MLEINKREAEKIYETTKANKSSIKRPDQYFKGKRKDVDQIIKYEIVPEIINDLDLLKDGKEIMDCKLFSGKYRWIKKIGTNAGMLAAYFNDALRYKIGKKRKKWLTSDYEIALEQIGPLREYVENVLKSYLKDI